MPDEYKNFYHRDMDGKRYDFKERLFPYEVKRAALHSKNEGNACDIKKLPPTTAGTNLFYSLHCLSNDRTEEDPDPHKD